MVRTHVRPPAEIVSPRVLAVLVASQLLFTGGDLLARANMSRLGFTASAFLAPWFVTWFVIRQLGGVGQLYVLARVPAGTTLSLFSASSIVLINVLAVLLLKEILSPLTYVGVSLAVAALLVLSFHPS